MHETTREAYALIDQADETLARCARERAARPVDQADALEAWRALRIESQPTTKKEDDRVFNSDMIAALARHEVLKNLREAGTVTKAEMQRALENLAEVLGEEVANCQNARIAPLQAEIKALQAEVETLRSEFSERGPLDLPKLQLIGARS